MGSYERGYLDIIQQAELVAKDPAAIAAYLRETAQKAAQGDDSQCPDAGTEKALLALNDGQVNIALALHCQFIETARGLFFTEPPNPAYRLAVLSNRRLGGRLWKFHPAELFDGNNPAMCAYLASASDPELRALFENPGLSDEFLSSFLRGFSVWECLSDEKRVTAMKALSANPRMGLELDPLLETDGLTSYEYDAVFDSAWHMAERLPATAKWAASLEGLLSKTCLKSHSLKDPITLADRWRGNEPEALQSGEYYLGAFSSMREALGRLAIGMGRTDGIALMEHDDIAFRSAAYSLLELTPEQMKAAYDKDGQLAVSALLSNEKLWQEERKRSMLHTLAWLVDKKNGPDALSEAHVFRLHREHHRAKHPEWFEAEDKENAPPRDPKEVPATRADMDALNQDLETAYSELMRHLTSIRERSGFILWFSLGALVGAWFS